MPRRPEARRSTLLAVLALVSFALVATGTVQGAGDSATRTAARAWHAVFGDRPAPAYEERQRVVVVLSAPSLADRVLAAEEPPGAEEQRRWTSEAEGAQQLLLAGLREREVHVRPVHVYTRTFNGFSAVVGPRALAELERAHGVAGVYPVRTVYPASPTAETLAGGSSTARATNGAGISLPGFTGSGVTVALLDSGVDRTHPFLRGRVLRGFDVVDGDRGVAPEAKPTDPAVLEAHGTRMAGLIVGAGGPDGLQGAAPGARILPIRIMGWHETADGGWAVLGRGDQLLAGLERAVDPDGDGDAGDALPIAFVGGLQPYAAFADSPETRAVAGAARLGTLVIAPVGNDGRPGPGFGSVAAPAAASDALAVGALDARPDVLQVGAEVRAGSDRVLDEPARILGDTGPQAPLRLDVATVLGPSLAAPERTAGEPATGDELGDFFGTDGVSLVAGKAAHLAAGGGALEPRVRNAAAAGAAAVLVSGASLPAGALALDDGLAVPVVGIPAEAGRELVAAARAGETSVVDLSAAETLANGALMEVAPFSSGGVAFDGRVKPDLVAPGVGLATGDPGGGGSYASVTGTSA
ncbi:MAG TPA: S8 family serine peptidase, partial [Gaiellaceae bacterium]|nr:S8 family serine peptidase [Gaiellaceae bacterium]